MDRERPDVLGADDGYEGEDEYDGEYDDEYDDEPGPETAGRSVVRAVLAPEALALASLVIAVASLLGFGLLNGSPYMPTQFSTEATPTDRSVLVLTVLLGAALALLPTALGVWALRRLPVDSPSRTTAGAGVLIAGLSFVLRLAIAARTAADDGNPFVQF